MNKKIIEELGSTATYWWRYLKISASFAADRGRGRRRPDCGHWRNPAGPSWDDPGIDEGECRPDPMSDPDYPPELPLRDDLDAGA